MSVLVTYKGLVLRELSSGTLTLSTAGAFLADGIEILNTGPRSAALYQGETLLTRLVAGGMARLDCAGKMLPGNIRLQIDSQNGSQFVPLGSDGLLTADSKIFLVQ